MKPLRLTLLLAFLPALAFAQETLAPKEAAPAAEAQTALTAESVTYQPDFCEFAVTFPSAPHTVRRCDDEDKNKCYDLVSYTQVYEMSATVNFRVICNAVDEAVHKNYDGDIMQATLRAMTDQDVIKTFDTSFREEEGFKQAGLVGEGKVGRTPTLYIGQMWIGKQSAMTIEAELIGEANEAADTLFSDILKSIGHTPLNPKKSSKNSPKETK